MLSRRKQLAINLMVTAFFVTSSVGMVYANSGGEKYPDKPNDYIGSYIDSGNTDATGGNVIIDSNVIGNVHGGYNAGTGNTIGNNVTISAGTVNEVCGGISNSGNANENVITISGGTISKDVYGGIGYNGNANENVITISGGTISKDVYGGNSEDGNADGNSVTITSGTSGYVYGGRSTTGKVAENIITISGGTIGNSVYGGRSDDGVATGNRVIISGGTTQNVYGGRSSAGSVTGNSVSISGGTTENIYGGRSSTGSVTGNIVVISGGTTQDVYGGYSPNTANANDNSVMISGGAISNDVFVGYSVNGDANGNILNISNGTAQDVSAGVSINGSATSNIINISGGNIRDVSAGISSGNAKGNRVNIYNGSTRDVSAGISNDGDAEDNIASISGGTITNIFGGYTSSTGSAKNNSVHISGGTITANIFGGYSVNGAAINNTVIIKGNPIFDASSVIYGGHTTSLISDVLTGNRLEVYRSTNSVGTHAVKGVENFEKMNFYLGNTTKNGDVMLKVIDAVKLDKTAIGVDIASGEKPKLVVGDKVTLLESDNSFNGMPKSQTVYAGIEKVYGLDFFNEQKKLGVTVNKVKENSKVRSIPVAQMTGQSMLRMGGDTIAMQGMTSALVATKIEKVENPNEVKGDMPNLSTEKSFLNKGAVFATMGGGTSKYKTSGTSDVNSFNIVTGMAWRINQPKNNNLILGAFFESGSGNYTTHNSYADGNVRGDGSSDYLGGGILGRYEFSCGTYVEGSVRMGRVKNDYHSNDLRGAGDGRVGYNTSDNYTGAHLGLGYIKKINDQTELDLYGKYLYTHQGGSSITMVGDNISFDPTNSHRLRLGARLAQKTTKDFNGYVGLAYEYEFDGKMGSSINYNPILAPSVKGASGILELGVIFKPTSNKNLSIDLSVNGYAGKREGVSGNLQLKYLF